MTLSFRNLDVSPSDPVENWGVEGILSALERGSIDEWQRVAAAVLADPDGPFAADLKQAVGLSESPAVNRVMRRVLDEATGGDRERVRRRVARAVRRSGLSAREFAERVDTSPSRLSTYVTGKVVPSAAMLVRIEREAARLAARRLTPPNRDRR